jgi:hypothetical protein
VLGSSETHIYCVQSAEVQCVKAGVHIEPLDFEGLQMYLDLYHKILLFIREPCDSSHG